MSPNNFIKSLALSILFAAVAGCGSSSSTTIVNASVSVPFELLQVDSYVTRLTLNDSTTGEALQPPITLVKDDTNSTWTAEMKDIDKRDYQAVVEIVVTDSWGECILARAERDVSINKGAPYATLTFKPSDFDTVLDDDSDGVTNATEYLYELNSHDTDTNHDGISDFDEIAAMAGGAA